MKQYNQRVGKFGENIAVRYLRKNGYKILHRNVHFRCGEIDIIAQKEDMLYFVEVKTRTSNIFGYLEDAISEDKLNRLGASIELYLLKNKLCYNYNLFFIFVILDFEHKNARVSLFKY